MNPQYGLDKEVDVITKGKHFHGELIWSRFLIEKVRRVREGALDRGFETLEFQRVNLLNEGFIWVLVIARGSFLVLELSRDIINQDLHLVTKDSIENDLGEGESVITLCWLGDLSYDVLDNVVRLLLRAKETFIEGLGPDNTVDELLWLLPDGAHWEALILGPIHTLVALSLALANRDTL
jgi:hypothetical protein